MTEKNIYRFTNALVLFICCLLCLEHLTGAKEFSWGVFLLGSTALALLGAWSCLEQKGRVILVLSVLLAFAGYYFVAGRDAFELERIKGNAVAVLLALLCFVVELVCQHVFWVRFAVAGAGMVWLLSDLFTNRDLSHMNVVFIVLYIVIAYVEWAQRHWEKQKIIGKRHYMVRIMPFLVCYLILMTVMSAPDEPYDWKFLKDAYAKVRQVILDISRNVINGDREDFAYGNSGFDGESSLLGQIKDDDQTLMTIRGQAGLKTNVYLMGKIYDTFTGKGWEATDESVVDDRQLDGLETLYAVRAYDPSGEEKYLERTGLYMWYDDFRTSYLFAPLKTVRMQDLEHIRYAAEGGNYVFDEKQGYGLEYSMTFMQLNVDHPVFYEFLEQEHVPDEAIFEQVQMERLKEIKYSAEDLEAHRQHIASVYGTDCVISEEVRQWIAQNTKDAATDIQRLKAIEAALLQMEYTQTPGALPKNIDSEGEFLDYFLLESKQGYCVYYATAFVLLARAEGLPARYVEGFCVPVPGRYNVPVKSNMAHAWPEVYIEGVGWIPFEPTPGYETVRYTPWEITSKQLALGNDKEHSLKEDIPEEQETEEEETPMPEEQEEVVDFVGVWPVVGLTVVVALLLAVLLWWIEVLLRLRRMKRSNMDTRFLLLVQMNMRLLGYLGYERKECETLAELQKRAWAIMDSEEGEKPEFLFLQYYQEYLYGQYPVTEFMVETVLQEKVYLLQLLKKWKPAMYFYCKLKAY